MEFIIMDRALFDLQIKKPKKLVNEAEDTQWKRYHLEIMAGQSRSL